MERLTEKGNYSNYNRKLNVTVNQIEDKLGEYEDLEEFGRLLILPCAEKDLIYVIQNNTEFCSICDYFNEGSYGSDDMCENDVPDENMFYPQYADSPICGKHFYEIVERRPNLSWIIHNKELFNETWFLDVNKAEDKLKELQST